MSERNTSGFGAKLREARERRILSLRDIANATKISVGSLEALERNDISRLPGGIFSRAFVRAYAIEVGLDPDAAIQEFIAQFPHDSVTAGHPVSLQAEDNVAIEGERQTASVFLRLIVVCVPIAIALLYFGSFGRHVEPAPAQAPSAPVASPEADRAPRPPIDTASAAPADTLVVSLSATRACWIRLVVDGERTIERELQAGEQQRVEVRRDLLLKVGDAAAIVMTLNGATARALGPAGEVVTTHMTLANFMEYVTVP